MVIVKLGGEVTVLNNQLVEQIVDTIVSLADPERIILFGSMARGEEAPGSDLDILVLKQEVSHPHRESAELRLALLDVPYSMDIIVRSSEQFEQNRDSWWTIFYPAAREGLVLYERSA